VARVVATGPAVVDRVRALGDEWVLDKKDRTQRLVGWYTRVVTRIDDACRPPEDRLCRNG
jgi:hypothetical protein